MADSLTANGQLISSDAAFSAAEDKSSMEEQRASELRSRVAAAVIEKKGAEVALSASGAGGTVGAAIALGRGDISGAIKQGGKGILWWVIGSIGLGTIGLWVLVFIVAIGLLVMIGGVF